MKTIIAGSIITNLKKNIVQVLSYLPLAGSFDILTKYKG